MIPKKINSTPQFFPPLLLSKQTFEKRFLFPTHSLFQKMDKHENENYDQCDPIQIQSLDIIRTFVPRTRTKAEVTKGGCEEIDNDALPSSWTL